MDYLIHQLLGKENTESIFKQLLAEKTSWEDGSKTAGTHAAIAKENLQLKRSSKTSKRLANEIKDLITADLLIKSYALPRLIHSIMFTRTSIGQGYGTHVDNAYMCSGRSDLSFTIFLNEPEDYEGGELCILDNQSSKKIKLEAGQVVIYPSTSLHSVETVTKGERIVCVGWIQSYISSNEDRVLLFGLDAGARGLLAQNGRSPELDLIFQAYTNLLRRLGR